MSLLIIFSCLVCYQAGLYYFNLLLTMNKKFDCKSQIYSETLKEICNKEVLSQFHQSNLKFDPDLSKNSLLTISFSMFRMSPH